MSAPRAWTEAEWAWSRRAFDQWRELVEAEAGRVLDAGKPPRDNLEIPGNPYRRAA